MTASRLQLALAIIVLITVFIAPFTDAVIHCSLKDGRKFQHGHEWKDGPFFKRCVVNNYSWSVAIAACVTADGRRVAMDASVMIGNNEYRCVNKGGRIGLMKNPERAATKGDPTTESTKVSCKDHNAGETWTTNNFKLTCDSQGVVKVLGCTSKEGINVPVNNKVVQNQVTYTCDMTEKDQYQFAARHSKCMSK